MCNTLLAEPWAAPQKSRVCHCRGNSFSSEMFFLLNSDFFFSTFTLWLHNIIFHYFFLQKQQINNKGFHSILDNTVWAKCTKFLWIVVVLHNNLKPTLVTFGGKVSYFFLFYPCFWNCALYGFLSNVSLCAKQIYFKYLREWEIFSKCHC